MSGALKRHLTEANKTVPQTEKDHPNQVRNNAGGFSFQVTPEVQLRRFLILGTDGGTYYVNEKDLTKKNVDFIVDFIKRDPEYVLSQVVEVSEQGLAYRNSAAIFVMALLYKHAVEKFKPLLKFNFTKVVRTSTHLFEFAEYTKLLGGWGRAKTGAVAHWYTSKSADQLAYQAVKYRRRNDWTHRDLFRLSHPTGVDQRVGNFILGKGAVDPVESPNMLVGFDLAQKCETISDLLNILDSYQNLPWEAIPTQYLKSREVWKKLFYNNQLNGQALLRNVTRLAKLEAFNDMQFARDFSYKLADAEMIRKTRLHPIQYLLALVNYTEGTIDRGKHSYGFRTRGWIVKPPIRVALNAGFYEAFKHVEPANKRTLIGLDVSGSMSSNAIGIDLSCAQVGTAMSMAIARTEPMYDVYGFSDRFVDLGISPNMSLEEITTKINRMNFGGTDCALPMIYAKENNIAVDTFVVMTDCETWAGSMHPHVALERYRQHSGIDAKLVVMGMTATNISIANPMDPGMLDIAGADASVPKLVSDFSVGRV